LRNKSIPKANTQPYLFLTRAGNPFSTTTLRSVLSSTVLRYTNKRFYPHLIRTIWATEFISKTRDFTTAAHMLGDTVQMVLKRYQEILEKDHQDKASQFLTATLQ
jgi:site-specific recombinase XerD